MQLRQEKMPKGYTMGKFSAKLKELIPDDAIRSESVNLILDTILASKEMQDDHSEEWDSENGVPEERTILENEANNSLRAQIRAVVEGMKA